MFLERSHDVGALRKISEKKVHFLMHFLVNENPPKKIPRFQIFFLNDPKKYHAFWNVLVGHLLYKRDSIFGANAVGNAQILNPVKIKL